MSNHLFFVPSGGLSWCRWPLTWEVGFSVVVTFINLVVSWWTLCKSGSFHALASVSWTGRRSQPVEKPAAVQKILWIKFILDPLRDKEI